MRKRKCAIISTPEQALSLGVDEVTLGALKAALKRNPRVQVSDLKNLSITARQELQRQLDEEKVH